MISQTFTLKTITPIFSYGTTGTPEIRPSAIKGELRFWFRAMMGGVLGRDWKLVKKLEANVFGSTEQRSSFDIRVKLNIDNITIRNKNAIVPEINKDGKAKEGFLYLALGFQTFSNKIDKKNYILQKSVFWPSNNKNGDFEVSFVFRDSNVKNIVLGSLWMLENFGGIGQRIRRGFGGIRVINPPEDFLYKWDKKNPAGLKVSLSAIAKEYSDYARSQHIQIPIKDIFSATDSLPKFSCFAKWRLMYGRKNDDDWDSWIEALDFAGIKMKEFRTDESCRSRFGCTHDYKKVVSDFFKGNCDPEKEYDFKNDAFGLPIQYRSFTRSNPREGREFKASLEAEILPPKAKMNSNIDRRASPLFIRPVFISENEYGIILLFFNAEFLPRDSIEVLKPKGKWDYPEPIPVTPANLGVIHSFIDIVEDETDSIFIGNDGGKIG